MSPRRRSAGRLVLIASSVVAFVAAGCSSAPSRATSTEQTGSRRPLVRVTIPAPVDATQVASILYDATPWGGRPRQVMLWAESIRAERQGGAARWDRSIWMATCHTTVCGARLRLGVVHGFPHRLITERSWALVAAGDGHRTLVSWGDRSRASQHWALVQGRRVVHRGRLRTARGVAYARGGDGRDWAGWTDGLGNVRIAVLAKDGLLSADPVGKGTELSLLAVDRGVSAMWATADEGLGVLYQGSGSTISEIQRSLSAVSSAGYRPRQYGDAVGPLLLAWGEFSSLGTRWITTGNKADDTPLQTLGSGKSAGYDEPYPGYEFARKASDGKVVFCPSGQTATRVGQLFTDSEDTTACGRRMQVRIGRGTYWDDVRY